MRCTQDQRNGGHVLNWEDTQKHSNPRDMALEHFLPSFYALRDVVRLASGVVLGSFEGSNEMRQFAALNDTGRRILHLFELYLLRFFVKSLRNCVLERSEICTVG